MLQLSLHVRRENAAGRKKSKEWLTLPLSVNELGKFEKNTGDRKSSQATLLKAHQHGDTACDVGTQPKSVDDYQNLRRLVEVAQCSDVSKP